MHEIDVQKWHYDVRSKYSTRVKST